jgi:ribosome maturation factor RimP
MEIVEKVKKLLKDVIEENNYILDDVEYIIEGKVAFLRIYIDKEGFISIDDCVKVSNLINPILDEADLIEGNYMLDVCSKEKDIW